jgi:hypothetical protein
MRLLDLFCGRWGWSRAFAARGWECVGVDLQYPPELPVRCEFVKIDVLEIKQVGGILLSGRDPSAGESLHYASMPHADYWLGQPFDFIVASPPCEEFSKYGLRCFYPDMPYPSVGIKLFNHTRELLWKSELPWVMENVRAAQDFVGKATHRCGPFYLWGTGVPPLMPQGIQKGLQLGTSGFTGEKQKEWRRKYSNPSRDAWSGSQSRAEATAEIAKIPAELASCVADYAERLLEARTTVAHGGREVKPVP